MFPTSRLALLPSGPSPPKTFLWHWQKHVRVNELEHLRARSQLLTSSVRTMRCHHWKNTHGELTNQFHLWRWMPQDVYIPHDVTAFLRTSIACQLSVAREISFESSRHRLEITIDKCGWPLVRGKRVKLWIPGGLHLFAAWGNLPEMRDPKVLKWIKRYSPHVQPPEMCIW